MDTTGTVALPSGNATKATLTFKTAAGNMVVAADAPDANNPPSVRIGSASACRYAVTIHATYTVNGADSTGKFAGATGSGKAAVVFEFTAPKYTSGTNKGKCNLSNNAQPLSKPAPVGTFTSTGPLTLKH